MNEPRQEPRERDVAARAHVLVVDDDEVASRALAKLLRGEGFVVSTASSGEQALAEARRALPDIVLTDLAMAPMNGVELCRQLHRVESALPVIVMSGRSDMQSVLESLRVGAEDYLLKPLDFDAVVWCVRRAIARCAAKLEHEGLCRMLNERLVLTSLREQEHAEAEALQRAQLNTLLVNLNEGVVIAGQSGNIVMMNDAAVAILGFAPDEARAIDTLYSREVRDLEGRILRDEERPLMRALRGDQFTDSEVIFVLSNGERRRVASTGTCVRDEKHAVALAIVVFRDVTELRRLEAQRDEYLGLITHDLRNPLNSISMCVSMLKNSLEAKRITEQDVDLADRAERSVKRMASMLDELTEATSLASKGLSQERAPCDMRAIVAGAVDGMDGARARISVEADSASSYVVMGDVAQLERVVVNLLTNALKYSPEDALVTVRLVGTPTEVELDVVDRGIGIAPESVAMLFARYYRTKPGKARASGLGLGLYIAHLIVDAHGGRISVTSEVGKGSTFRLSLPRPASR